MNYYLTEKEQIAQMKEWWNEYGKAIAVGVILGVAIMFGWRYWHDYRESQQQQASLVYEQLLQSIQVHEEQVVAAEATRLVNEFSSTTYSDFGRLILAKLAVEKSEYDTAKKWYSEVTANSKMMGLRQVARIRHARLLIAEGKSEKALGMLAEMDDKAFLPLINAVRGDAYWALNKKKEAQDAYKKAVETSSEAIVELRPIIQMKLDNVWEGLKKGVLA